MASESITLPVIDFSSEDLKPGTPTWNSVKIEVRKALEEFGCFKALNDKIPVEISKELFGLSEEFFDLPLEIKARYSFNKSYVDYINQQVFEAVGVENSTTLEGVKSFTDVMWPQGNPKFSKILQNYSERLFELEKTVRRMVLESLSLEKYMDEHMNSTENVLRLMKYTPQQTNETQNAMMAHTDKGTMTILTQKQTNGLEIQTKDGQWFGVNLCPNTFFVLIGDVFHAWTNGRLHAPFHRVMLTGNNQRYSAGLFSDTKTSYMVKAPEELVDEEHPLLYKPFAISGLKAFFDTNEGRKSQNILKAYCGV